MTIKNSDWNQWNIDQVNCPGIGGERHRGLAGELEILVEKAREGLLTSSEGQRYKIRIKLNSTTKSSATK